MIGVRSAPHADERTELAGSGSILAICMPVHNRTRTPRPLFNRHVSELTEQRHAVTNQFQPEASARAEPVAGCQSLRCNARTRPRRLLGRDGDDGSKRSRHTLSRASPSGHATGVAASGCLLLLPSCRRTSGSVALGCLDCAGPRARPAGDTSRVRVASGPSRHREPARRAPGGRCSDTHQGY